MWSRNWQNNWVRNKVTSHSIESVGQAVGVRSDERCRQITFGVDTAACRTGVPTTRFRCTRFFQGRKVSGKPDAESLGTISKGTIHNVYATSSEYPGKERTIVGKNTSQTSLM